MVGEKSWESGKKNWKLQNEEEWRHEYQTDHWTAIWALTSDVKSYFRKWAREMIPNLTVFLHYFAHAEYRQVWYNWLWLLRGSWSRRFLLDVKLWRTIRCDVMSIQNVRLREHPQQSSSPGWSINVPTLLTFSKCGVVIWSQFEMDASKSILSSFFYQGDQLISWYINLA